GFELRGAVAVTVKADAVEIPLADIHIEITRPVIRDALIIDEAPCPKTADPVWPAAKRRRERRAKLILGVIALREDRQHSGNEKRQIARLIAGEGDFNNACPVCLNIRQLTQILRDQGVSFFFQKENGENNIFFRERCSIMEICTVTQMEGKAVSIVRCFNAFGDKSVNSVRFVIGAHHQRVEDEVEPLRRGTTQYVAVQ